MFNFDKKPSGPLCPYFAAPCKKHDCMKWIHVTGKHPQSGVELDMWDCADRWMPVLLMDLTKRVNEQGAAIESLRNRVKDAGDSVAGALQNLAYTKPGLLTNGE